MEKRGDTLDTKIQKLDKELARYTDQLKKMKPGPAKQAVQKRAMTILKQKKMYEGQKEKTVQQQFNMDQIMFAQEGLKETADTVVAMKDANKALKKQFKAININQVRDPPGPDAPSRCCGVFCLADSGASRSPALSSRLLLAGRGPAGEGRPGECGGCAA